MIFGLFNEDKEIKKSNIRHKYDTENDIWYYSVVDTIRITTKTKDPRNYWKVLKNRLKKQINNELVTKCNQLKLTSKDGKSYKSDTLSAEYLLKLVSIIAPEYKEKFIYFLESVEGKKHVLPFKGSNRNQQTSEIETSVSIDSWQSEKLYFIRFMAPGIPFQNLEFCFENDHIIITGKRPKENNFSSFLHSDRDYFKQELFWDDFSRKIKLEIPIEKDSFIVSEYKGSYILKFSKIKQN